MSSGEVGVLELSDLIITTKGTATHFAGVEWNMKGDLVGDYPGMWGNVHDKRADNIGEPIALLYSTTTILNCQTTPLRTNYNYIRSS